MNSGPGNLEVRFGRLETLFSTLVAPFSFVPCLFAAAGTSSALLIGHGGGGGAGTEFEFKEGRRMW